MKKKTPGKKRKTIIYWKKLLREANIDWTEAGRMAQDRSAWKEVVSDETSGTHGKVRKIVSPLHLGTQRDEN